jgi:hypothetical protein
MQHGEPVAVFRFVDSPRANRIARICSGEVVSGVRVIAPIRSGRPGLTEPPIARPAILARAISLNRLPVLPAKTSGAALRLVAGSATADSLIAGAAAVQACGTDNAPTEVAWPTPADTAVRTAPNWSNRFIIRPSMPES